MWTALQDKSQQTLHQYGRRIVPWAGIGVERVNDTERRSESSVGDTSLGGERRVIEDGSSSRLGSSSSGGGDGDQRSERLADGQSFSDRRIDEVEKLGVGVASEQVGDLKCNLSQSLKQTETRRNDAPWQCQ